MNADSAPAENGPASLEQLEAQLGNQTEVFHAGKRNVKAAAGKGFLSGLFGALITFGGISGGYEGLVNLPAGSNSWIWILLGAGGVVLLGLRMQMRVPEHIVKSQLLAALSVHVCRDGFFTARKSKHGLDTDVFPWDQIEWVQETAFRGFMKDGEGSFSEKYRNKLLEQSPSKHSLYTVKRKDGHQFRFDRETIEDVVKFARLLQGKLQPLNIPWHVGTNLEIGSITIRVNPETARAYRNAPEENRQKLEMMLSQRLTEALANSNALMPESNIQPISTES